MFAYLKKIVVLVLLAALASLAGCAIWKAAAVRPPVILVSLDGFRPDYLERGVTPNLNALAANGARAPCCRPFHR